MSHPLVNLYQARVDYLFSGLTHTFQTWLLPSSFTLVATGTLADYDLITHTGVQTAQQWTDDFLDVFKLFFASTTSIVDISLWAYEAGETNGNFLASGSSSIVGTNVNPNIQAAQTICTIRTATGRVKKLSFEENTSAAALPSSWASLVTGPFSVLGAYVLSDQGSSMCARDGSQAVSLMRVSPGQNEATFRRRYRPD